MKRISKEKNDSNFINRNGDKIEIELLNRRIKYFFNVLLKYLKIRESIIDNDDADLNKILSSFEKMVINRFIFFRQT